MTNAYHKLVAEQLAEVQDAQRKHNPTSHLIERNRKKRHAELFKENRFSCFKVSVKRAFKWLKGGV
ncbi:hypothetical protein [Terasakiella sp.]|uniref:hypothetical protein n=1 Tax=Terasakiella sp. TaxID=2034861 RepID=UPI003AA92081